MVDSVSYNRGMHANGTMNAIGYGIAIILLVIVVPLLPFLAVLYLFVWLVNRSTRSGGEVRSSIS